MLFLAGFCDFEMDFCGWVNNPSAASGVDWDWLSGGSEGPFIPNRDHSTNSVLGKSAQIYCNYWHHNEAIHKIGSTAGNLCLRQKEL